MSAIDRATMHAALQALTNEGAVILLPHQEGGVGVHKLETDLPIEGRRLATWLILALAEEGIKPSQFRRILEAAAQEAVQP